MQDLSSIAPVSKRHTDRVRQLWKRPDCNRRTRNIGAPVTTNDIDALRDFETIPLDESRTWRSLQWYLRGRDDERSEHEQRIAALVDGLERAMQLLAYGDFKNGNTDPTGSLDEGEVLAGRIYEELRALADGEEGTLT